MGHKKLTCSDFFLNEPICGNFVVMKPSPNSKDLLLTKV